MRDVFFPSPHAFETYKWPSENWFFSEIDKISIWFLSVPSYFSRVVCVFIRIEYSLLSTRVQICVFSFSFTWCACVFVFGSMFVYVVHISFVLPVCLLKYDSNHAHSFPNIVYSGRLDLLINWEEKLTEWHWWTQFKKLNCLFFSAPTLSLSVSPFHICYEYPIYFAQSWFDK